MNERENLMYQILGSITQSEAPIVFKGALITKLILQEENYTRLSRATKDIDATWVEAPPSMETLTRTINHSLRTLSAPLEAIAYRSYSDSQSAGLSIVELETGDEVLTMDIEMKSAAGSRIYHYCKSTIKGILPNEILADKISACSTDAVYKWRVKDLIDIFALSHCVRIQCSEVFDVCNRVGRKMKTFTDFYARRAEIEHAYQKLRGVEGKPSFSEVYCYL